MADAEARRKKKGSKRRRASSDRAAPARKGDPPAAHNGDKAASAAVDGPTEKKLKSSTHLSSPPPVSPPPPLLTSHVSNHLTNQSRAVTGGSTNQNKAWTGGSPNQNKAGTVGSTNQSKAVAEGFVKGGPPQLVPPLQVHIRTGGGGSGGGGSHSKSHKSVQPTVSYSTASNTNITELKEEGFDEDEDDDIIEPPTLLREDTRWKREDRLVLFDQIQSVLPVDINVKYSTMAEKLDWKRVKVTGYSPTDCKEEWLRITTKLRRFRTMSELLVDAKLWAKQPWNAFGKKTVKHPDMPKKPLTPYFRFFIAKRLRLSAKHPEMSVTDLTKELSKKFAQLSERKKAKYTTQFNKDMEEWRIAMDAFRGSHPDMFTEPEKAVSMSPRRVGLDAPAVCSGGGVGVVGGGIGGGNALLAVNTGQGGLGGPPKTITAMQLYINDMYEEENTRKSTLSRKELYEHHRVLWSQMSDSQKIPYINKAIEAKKQYDIDMSRYCSRYPNYHPREVKTFLSKAEQKIKDKEDGKPEKPPCNGYSLFTLETIPLLADLPNIERLGEVSHRWRKLSEDKREAYNLKADERNQAYRVQYEKYLQTLSAEERCKLEAKDSDKVNNSRKTTKTFNSPVHQHQQQLANGGGVVAEKRTKPIAAVFLFIRDNIETYRRTHPDMDDSEIQRQLVKEYNCLEEKDKARYKVLEEQEKQKQLSRDNYQTLTASMNAHRKLKTVQFPGEPPLPPHSGYQLFSKELLLQLKNVKSNERLQEIGKRWAQLSDEEKRKHNKRKDALWLKYRKEVIAFKKTLSPSELEAYENLHRPKKSKKKKKPVEEPVAEEEDADSSSAEEDAEEASGSDDDEEGGASAASEVHKEDELLDSSIGGDSASESSSSGGEEEEGGSVSESSVGQSESEEEEEDDETGYQLEQQLIQNSVNTAQNQGKVGKLSAASIYDSSEGEGSSSGDSESELST